MLPPFASLGDAAVLGVTVSANGLVRASTRIRTYLRAARYPLEIATPPDDLIELTCQIASRMDSTPAEMAQGVQQQSAGGYSVGYGWDAWKALSGLTAGELDALRRMYPPLPRTLSLGSPSGPNPDEAA